MQSISPETPELAAWIWLHEDGPRMEENHVGRVLESRELL